jgi:hypothetical protein
MSFKKNWNNIPKSLISQYKPNNPYNQPNITGYTNAFINQQNVGKALRNQEFNFHISRGLEQPNLTPYSQGNVGSKNN